MSTDKPTLFPKYMIYGFFLMGLASSIAFRAIILFQHLEPSWVRPLWYSGVFGYFFFSSTATRLRRKGKRQWRNLN